MLELKDIVKVYGEDEYAVTALDGVSIKFRENEFVSILGASGCGKTTMLNIIGGLDRYSSGDLIINGKSTKLFTDSDWDTYRNHSIGFVFQSYNLISHQTVLSNVELALTLSGVSPAERKERAIEALKKVGLEDQIRKKPNQLSGGQMQRVAIARALVNNPDILLADEPTGALDTQTSVQIMDILKEVAKEKLVIMVTHNPELAEQYSTRIIRASDGKVIGDTNPYDGEEAPAEAAAEKTAEETAVVAVSDKKASKKKNMSFSTALTLSFNNLLTKKARTILTSFAGSIGIIGIALILSLSNGVNLFIKGVQEDTLTSYPISITSQTSDYSAMVAAMVGTSGEGDEERDDDKIYVDDSISNMVSAMVTMDKNNLAKFNEYFESRKDEFEDDMLAVQYSYNMDLQIFNANSEYGKNGLIQVSPSDVLSDFGNENSGLSGITDSISIFSEIMPGKDGEIINDAIYEQYDLVDGRWPEEENELILIVDKHNNIANISLYMLGMLDPDEMKAMMASMMLGEEYEVDTQGMEFSFDDFYDLELFLAYNSDFYEKSDLTYEVDGEDRPIWVDKRNNEGFEAGSLRKNGIDLKIVGVVCPSEDATVSSLSGAIGYTSALTEAVLAAVDESEIVEQQMQYPTHDVFTGMPFEIEDADSLSDDEKIEKLESYFGSLDTAGKAQAYLGIRTEVTEDEMEGYLEKIKTVIDTPEAQKQFLIDLYGFNSGNGSLAVGTSANEAVAAILWASEMVPGVDSVEAYMQMVPNFGGMFELDGIPVTEETNPAVYETYEGLISTMYDTDEKMERAFDNMTEMTFKMVYGMVETQNVTNELKLPTAPHFISFMAESKLTKAELQQEVLTILCQANGITNITFDPVTHMPTDPLAQTLFGYVYSMSEQELAAKYYVNKIDTDEAFKNEAIAAAFDAYRADMLENNAEDYAALYENHMNKSETTYDENLVTMGASVSADSLASINIYPVDFEAKERLKEIITDYNEQDGLEEEDEISYVDIMAVMMSSVTVIVDAITYVLVAFVSISLVVSSIMIGIITYISVLERTKEIGILRSIGASKKDISRVFNAETLIIGFAAGAIGIVSTVILCLPINLIIRVVSGMSSIRASLPIVAAIVLVLISMFLTFIAGLVPSKIAAKKDPVEALRTE